MKPRPILPAPKWMALGMVGVPSRDYERDSMRVLGRPRIDCPMASLSVRRTLESNW